MPILQKLYRSTLCILACVIVLKLADSSSITNLTTILIMTDQHLEYKKPDTSTPAKVQNNAQRISYNNDRLLQIKKEMVRDKRYRRFDIDTIKTIRKYRLNRRGQRGGQKRHIQGKVDLGSLIIVNINEDISQLQVNNCSNIEVTLANIHSIRNKNLILYDYLQLNDSDICILTKTWLQNCDSDEIQLEMTDLNKNEFKVEVSNRTN